VQGVVLTGGGKGGQVDGALQEIAEANEGEKGLAAGVGHERAGQLRLYVQFNMSRLVGGINLFLKSYRTGGSLVDALVSLGQPGEKKEKGARSVLRPIPPVPRR
jgi:hypothetical protein